MNAEWLHWYYLIYLLPAAVAALVLLMTGLSGHHGSHGHAGHGGSHLHGGHGAGHGSSGVHRGVHSGTRGPSAANHSHARGHHSPPRESGPSRTPGVGHQLLGFFGVGRVPLTLVIGSLMIGWGWAGMAVTDTLQRSLHWPPALFVGPALAAAAAGSLATAKLFGELSVRLLPKDESYAIGREGLLGLTGKVVYPVTETGGRVHLFDQYRTLHVKPARVRPGEPPIENGTEVIVASLDLERDTLIVEPLGFQRSAMSERQSAIRDSRRSVKPPDEVELRNRES
jgi:membrane protein implicated in regulation of membrane protease activity